MIYKKINKMNQNEYILDMYINEDIDYNDILDLYEYGYISEDVLEYIEENKLTRGIRAVGHYASHIVDPNNLVAAYHAGRSFMIKRKIRKTKDPVEKMYLQKEADKHIYKFGRHLNNIDNKSIKYHLKQHLDARRSGDKDASEKHKLKAKALLNRRKEYSGLNTNQVKNKFINNIHKEVDNFYKNYKHL